MGSFAPFHGAQDDKEVFLPDPQVSKHTWQQLSHEFTREKTVWDMEE
jgi:hypothetical protein